MSGDQPNVYPRACARCRSDARACTFDRLRAVSSSGHTNTTLRAASGHWIPCASFTNERFHTLCRNPGRRRSAYPGVAVGTRYHGGAEIRLWLAFAQAMRDNAAATDALFTQRAAGVGTMSAPDNMRSYAQIARAYADNTERLAAAFDSLYASLSDIQKQATDKLFRQQATAATQPRSRR